MTEKNGGWGGSLGLEYTAFLRANRSAEGLVIDRIMRRRLEESKRSLPVRSQHFSADRSCGEAREIVVSCLRGERKATGNAADFLADHQAKFRQTKLMRVTPH